MIGTFTIRQSGLRRSYQRATVQRATIPGSIERWLCGGYAFFFAFLLPLLCWGTMADPQHPHQGAHFIFAEPPEVHLPGTSPMAIREHEPCLHPLGAHPPAPTLAASAPVSSPAKQAIPVTLLAELLLLVLWSATEIRRRPLVQLLHHHEETIRVGYSTRVPTPPPRDWLIDFGRCVKKREQIHSIISRPQCSRHAHVLARFARRRAHFSVAAY